MPPDAGGRYGQQYARRRLSFSQCVTQAETPVQQTNGGFVLKEVLKLRSGASIKRITQEQAQAKSYLTREVLAQMHLIPGGEPVAFACDDKVAQLLTHTEADGEDAAACTEAGQGVTFFFHPEQVMEAPPELWYFPDAKSDTMTLPSGSTITRMSIKRAASCGYYTRERLSQMNYKPIEEPVAFTYRPDRSVIWFYDKRTADRVPLPCIRCGKGVRFRKKLCEACYAKELEQMCIEDDIKRNTRYHMSRERVLFFDLELTGFYDHDEILSISIVDGNGKTVMNTLVKPEHTKKWKRTEKVHGITPDMVADAPSLKQLIPQIKDIFENADRLIAYGVSTDYSHIKYIYATAAEREALHDKTRCCANEFVRYIHEHCPDVVHASLVDAMETMGIAWDGIPHTSIADTIACQKVWDALFPHYYQGE